MSCKAILSTGNLLITIHYIGEVAAGKQSYTLKKTMLKNALRNTESNTVLKYPKKPQRKSTGS